MASSRTSRPGCRARARARASRWRCAAGERDPPLAQAGVRTGREAGHEAVRPRPCEGVLERAGCPLAGHRPGSGPAGRTLAVTGSANRNASCRTSATRRWRSAGSTSSSGTPPTRMRPWSGSARRTSSSHSVLLPLPVAPTSATISPGASVKLTSRSTGHAAEAMPDAHDLHAERAVRRQEPGRGRDGQPGPLGECRVDPVEGDDGHRGVLEEVADDPQRERQDAEQRHGLDELPGGHRSARDAPRADGDDRHAGQGGQQVEQRLEGRPQSGRRPGGRRAGGRPGRRTAPPPPTPGPAPSRPWRRRRSRAPAPPADPARAGRPPRDPRCAGRTGGSRPAPWGSGRAPRAPAADRSTTGW